MIKKCGFVGIVGRTNVGKSTLINILLAKELSVATAKRQTTRNNIQGVLTNGDEQIIFIDTPGVNFFHKNSLNSRLNKSATSILQDVDIILLVIEALNFNKEDQIFIENLENLPQDTKVYLLINKIDNVAKLNLLPFIHDMQAKYPFRAIVPISALKNDNIEHLLQLVRADLPAREHYYAENILSDKDESFFIAEEIRKQLILNLGKELPYVTMVTIDSIAEGIPCEILATIWVERDSQKAIVLGKGGHQIKEIGMRARHILQDKLQKKIRLKIIVKTRKNWRNDNRSLQEFKF